MDCVYSAYVDHLRWLDKSPYPFEYYYWKALKWWTHGSHPQYTFGGVVPDILKNLAGLHGLELKVEHRIYTYNHYMQIARDHYNNHFWLLSLIINHTDYGAFVHKITLKPAIYLLLIGQHAVFDIQVPVAGVPAMAIQLKGK